jgi:hypothetical protein
MSNIRKLGLVVVTALMSLGALGIAAPAHALDTGWGCPACKTSTHG